MKKELKDILRKEIEETSENMFKQTRKMFEQIKLVPQDAIGRKCITNRNPRYYYEFNGENKIEGYYIDKNGDKYLFSVTRETRIERIVNTNYPNQSK